VDGLLIAQHFGSKSEWDGAEAKKNLKFKNFKKLLQQAPRNGLVAPAILQPS
jgi:hypothetical protein